LPFISRSSAASGDSTFCGFGGVAASLAKAGGAMATPAAAMPASRKKFRRPILGFLAAQSSHIQASRSCSRQWRSLGGKATTTYNRVRII
jgi:hypothetical protein